MLANTFHHLYLRAGKLKDFIGPGTDIETSKEILFVFGGGGPCLGLGKCSTLLADPAQVHQDMEGLTSLGLLADLAESGQWA